MLLCAAVAEPATQVGARRRQAGNWASAVGVGPNGEARCPVSAGRLRAVCGERPGRKRAHAHTQPRHMTPTPRRQALAGVTGRPAGLREGSRGDERRSQPRYSMPEADGRHGLCACACPNRRPSAARRCPPALPFCRLPSAGMFCEGRRCRTALPDPLRMLLRSASAHSSESSRRAPPWQRAGAAVAAGVYTGGGAGPKSEEAHVTRGAGPAPNGRRAPVLAFGADRNRGRPQASQSTQVRWSGGSRTSGAQAARAASLRRRPGAQCD